MSRLPSTIRESAMCTFFFFNDTATTEIYTLSLHDALPILSCNRARGTVTPTTGFPTSRGRATGAPACSNASVISRSEEHTSELQSQSNLVCRLLLEKKTS